MRSETELLKKLIGWYGTYRGRFLLLKNKALTKEEFILFEASIALSDWDKNHTTTYGSFDLKQEEFEYLLGFTDGFVSRYGKKLFKKGFWKKRNDGLIQVLGFELIEINLLNKITRDKLIVDLQKYLAELQIQVGDLQQNNANLQQSASKGNCSRQPQKVANLQLSSPKSDLVSFKDRDIILRSDNEYEEIKKELDLNLLSVEDMKWIDLNVHEDPHVPS